MYNIRMRMQPRIISGQASQPAFLAQKRSFYPVSFAIVRSLPPLRSQTYFAPTEPWRTEFCTFDFRSQSSQGSGIHTHIHEEKDA